MMVEEGMPNAAGRTTPWLCKGVASQYGGCQEHVEPPIVATSYP